MDISSSNNYQNCIRKVDTKSQDNHFPIQLKLQF